MTPTVIWSSRRFLRPLSPVSAAERSPTSHIVVSAIGINQPPNEYSLRGGGGHLGVANEHWHWKRCSWHGQCHRGERMLRPKGLPSSAGGVKMDISSKRSSEAQSCAVKTMMVNRLPLATGTWASYYCFSFDILLYRMQENVGLYRSLR